MTSKMRTDVPTEVIDERHSFGLVSARNELLRDRRMLFPPPKKSPNAGCRVCPHGLRAYHLGPAGLVISGSLRGRDLSPPLRSSALVLSRARIMDNFVEQFKHQPGPIQVTRRSMGGSHGLSWLIVTRPDSALLARPGLCWLVLACPGSWTVDGRRRRACVGLSTNLSV